MAKKRRTRKDKQTARHDFLISWENGNSEPNLSTSVKGQKKMSLKKKAHVPSHSKSAKFSAKDRSWSVVRRDIVKSLLLTTFVFSLELVIYLVWK